MTTQIPLLIDTDPGVDDALALLMAFKSKQHALVGLTIAAGNVGLQHTCSNALKLCEVAQRTDVPVYAGCATPILYPAPYADDVHGSDGFGGVGYVPAQKKIEDEHAALAIIRLSHAYAGRLLLVTLGPLTNIALALKLDPTLPERIDRLVVMGGAVQASGNITAAAEFNVYFDPEAAFLVFSSFKTFDLCDWKATLAHGLHHANVDRWLSKENAVAKFYNQISSYSRQWSADRRGDHWHSADALAMAYALYPEHALDMAERSIQVSLEHGAYRGATLVDWLDIHQIAENRVRILQSYDQAAFENIIQESLTG